MSVSQLEAPARWRGRLCLSSFAVAGITALILWAALDDLLRQGGLGTVLSAGRAELAAPLLVVLVVATGMCERIFPAERRPLLARGHVQDAATWPTGFLLATVPVVVLMPTRPIAPVLITGYVCIGTLQHANLRWTFGPLGRVIVSPAYHRLHHAPDTQGLNLGVVLTIWDVLARCARFPVRGQVAGRTGLDGRPVPVEQAQSARPAPLLLAEQLIEPFRAQT